MIVRNTLWSLSFLQNWWDIANKTTTCDQHAFDALYLHFLHSSSRNRSEINSKIKILSTDALNTHPPAFKYFAENPVLHLMGESSLYRASVFRRAFQSICSARSGGKLAKSLGLSRSFLAELAK
jgi:hypothetical protein